MSIFSKSASIWGAKPPARTTAVIEEPKKEEQVDISKEVCGRLSKMLPKDGILSKLHVKDDYIEATDGKSMIRESLGAKQMEESFLAPKTFEKTDGATYPAGKLNDMLTKTKALNTIFNISLSRDVLYKVCQAIQEGDLIQLEIKGTESPVYFKSKCAEGLFMPYKITSTGAHPRAVSAPPPPSTPTPEPEQKPEPKGKVVRIIIENGKVVDVIGLPDGYTFTTEAK